jgi:hypothetical protein
MKNEITKQIFEKMKFKNFGESLCNETKYKILSWIIKQMTTKKDGKYVVFQYPERDGGLEQLSVTLDTLEEAREFVSSWKPKKLFIYKFIED